MATRLCQGRVGGDMGGKTLSTGQGEFAAGFGMCSITAREVCDVLLWDTHYCGIYIIVFKKHAHMPYLSTYLCTHTPLGRGMLQDKVHRRDAAPPVGLVCCEEGIVRNILVGPWNTTP